jgi:glucokinase
MKENDWNVNCQTADVAESVDPSAVILAGDIGGTKTHLGLFDRTAARPQPIEVHTFATSDYPDLASMMAAFAARVERGRPAIEHACLGVAGPVVGTTAQLTNVPWRVDIRDVTAAFNVSRVSLLNDLEAMAYAVPVLEDFETHALQAGVARADGNMALIASGTGLGQALLHDVSGDLIPSPSEGGHADWAPRTEREIAVLRYLIKEFGRAEVERVISGPGLVNIHRVTHTGACAALASTDDLSNPRAITVAALERRCPGCIEALSIFVDALGAEAGNLALRSVATRGVFVGGGVPAKILGALTDGTFIRAFRDKPPFDAMLAAIPVKVIINPIAGLLGAAVYAARG